MVNKNLILVSISVVVVFMSCNQVAEKVSQEAQNVVYKTTEKAQKVINDLGLVYVEEGAQQIITYDEVNAAQQAWCDTLVRIGQVKEEGIDYKALAVQFLTDAYNYDHGKVFFKPTLAFGDQTFWNDKNGALSYFVGGDPEYPYYKGFALAPWVKVRYDNVGSNNEGIQIYGSVAITMGNVWVTGKDGKEVMVDKTLVFKKGKDGKLRIVA